MGVGRYALIVYVGNSKARHGVSRALYGVTYTRKELL